MAEQPKTADAPAKKEEGNMGLFAQLGKILGPEIVKVTGPVGTLLLFFGILLTTQLERLNDRLVELERTQVIQQQQISTLAENQSRLIDARSNEYTDADADRERQYWELRFNKMEVQIESLKIDVQRLKEEK